MRRIGAVDIDGTKFAVGIVRDDGKFLHRTPAVKSDDVEVYGNIAPGSSCMEILKVDANYIRRIER